ncbi:MULTISPECIES: DMT family transporter [unclassified Streptomyces]|uniref:DMT family transporter n=1 Tax=unclassified Streptomyces TaxID=2593676 RepID=UPI002E273375
MAVPARGETPAGTAMGTAFQRKAAATTSRSGLRLLAELVHRAAWVIGMAGVIGAAVFQSLALVNGPLALVQPLFILELPFALLIAAPLMHRRLPDWAGLVGSARRGGRPRAGPGLRRPARSHGPSPLTRWIPALCLCLGAMAAAVLLAGRGRPAAVRAALLGAAAAIGNALTAALLKSATGTFADHGFAAFLTSWQTYGFALAGVTAVLLLENALQPGPLAASQPALTIGDAAVSLALGITLFDEEIRTGWWLVPMMLGALLIVTGVLVLSRAVQALVELAR